MRFKVYLAALCFSLTVRAQVPVIFHSSDSSKIKAELYLQNNRYPFIIILHEKENSGEISSVAPRFLNLNYNCLSVAVKGILSAQNDVHAAIRYSKSISNRPVVLVGSTRCASLCLLIASRNPDVSAVIALSPGEYFQPALKIRNIVKELKQQVFVCSNQNEYPYLQQMFSDAPADIVTLFRPDKITNFRGAALLQSTNPTSGEYWFALTMFFKKLEESQKV